MKIRFCGAAQNVTGSQFLLTVNGSRVLIDCGLFQGRRKESYERNEKFMFDPATVNAVLLTHAHMDHTGNTPNLIKQGYTGELISTEATADLCRILLKDSAYLQEREIYWVNKIRARHHEEPMKVLYTPKEAEAAIEHFSPRPYDQEFTVAPGVTATFRDAGHILGSSSISLQLEENGRKIRLGVAVDVGRPNMPMERDPNVLRDMDALIMETTYGNREHEPIDGLEDQLAETINEAVHAGGRILIPAFAVGRTQMLVYLLHRLFNQNRIPEIPIFVDSPMASEATEVYRRHVENLDRATMRTFVQDGEDPFGFGRLTYVKDVKDSKGLNGLSYPHIIIASSGMCEGGRILHHLVNNISNPKTLLLFVGYAARNTLARRILEGNETVKIFGEEHRVRCKVRLMNSFSAHADRHDLLAYARMTPPSKLKRIFLVHGEEDQALPFRDALRSSGYDDVSYPALGDTIEL